MSQEREKDIETAISTLNNFGFHRSTKVIKDLRAERDALLKDAERMAWLAANIEWDGYGHWLPELHVELREHASNRDCLNAAIDAAMTSSSKEGK